ncbi:hypothetical protein H5407_23240 [Mitsuaria sp. WAJ17]|uniref:hypothetical protein n=1 Tax=Mitsuaria sp. WAJ17 TaxID=2761452 RepID=UPI0016031DF1|nr:hypothetical protein [Mitsuaria sp. WAJ17]MBB2488153.1 hypothetical protein [Mitsuaria sp. WAJ17]
MSAKQDRTARRRLALLAYAGLAVLCLVGGLALLWPADPPAESVPVASVGGSGRAGSGLAAAPASGAAAASAAPHPWLLVGTSGPAVSDDLADHVPAGSAPGMQEVIERLHKAGVRTGLGAFQPPGTRPPIVGLAVPEDYVLPDGYVRHHQATDDGQRIEAILMFAPDRPVHDAQGRPIAVPADRVVTPALAPPGFPIRFVVIPRPQEPVREAPGQP